MQKTNIVFDAESVSISDLNLAPVAALHRHHDGYVAFAVSRDRGEDFRPLVSIRRDELALRLPDFRHKFLKDAYASINAGWRLRRRYEAAGRCGYPCHRTYDLRFLCAAYADLDYYRLGLGLGFGFEATLSKIVTLQDQGNLPRASIVVNSGRGMWLLYLLHDENNPPSAPRAFPEKREQYLALQKAIIERLAPFGADSCACDAARHIRMPGSFHTGAEASVEWSIQGEGSSACSFSLSELCRYFPIQRTPKSRKERAAIEEPEREKHRLGWRALNACRLRDFNRLRAMRQKAPRMILARPGD
jgi:hypothetical protein